MKTSISSSQHSAPATWVRSIALAALFTLSGLDSAIAARGPAGDRRPCQNIGAACRAAGYVKGAPKNGANKELITDCIKPIMSGQAVPGVAVNPTDIDACKAVRARRKAGN